MNPVFIFWLIFSLITSAVILCDYFFGMLRDTSTAAPKPFSYSRVQLAWWTIIIFSSIISALFLHNGLPVLFNSTLYLLGIASGTTAAARLIDVSDQLKNNSFRHQDMNGGTNFLMDILSDGNGISIHRFQTVLFNILLGCWFIYNVVFNLAAKNIEGIIPDIQPNYLVLLSLSTLTYTALKATENKCPVPHVESEFVSESVNKVANVPQG
jgi:hypothetical protein